MKAVVFKKKPSLRWRECVVVFQRHGTAAATTQRLPAEAALARAIQPTAVVPERHTADPAHALAILENQVAVLLHKQAGVDWSACAALAGGKNQAGARSSAAHRVWVRLHTRGAFICRAHTAQWVFALQASHSG